MLDISETENLSGISIVYFQSNGILSFGIKTVKLGLIFRTILKSVIVFIAENILAGIAIKKMIFWSNETILNCRINQKKPTHC